MARGVVDGVGEACHLPLRHRHARVAVAVELRVGHLVDRVSQVRLPGVHDVILHHVALADDRHGARQLMLEHPVHRLDADDVVRALVPCYLLGGDVHQPDGLRHDDVSGDLLVDIQCPLAQAGDDIGVLQPPVDLLHADPHRVVVDPLRDHAHHLRRHAAGGCGHQCCD